MEDVLEVYERPYNPKEPVICFDEKPVQLLDDARPTRPARHPGELTRRDYEYVRKGTATIFYGIEPRTGEHIVRVTKQRGGRQFTRMMQALMAKHSRAKAVHVVMDNLSTHREAAVKRTLGMRQGRALWKKLTVHYTPVHASWLNQAELGLSILARQSLGRQRIATVQELQSREAAWAHDASAQHMTVNWTFTRQRARKKFDYG